MSGMAAAAGTAMGTAAGERLVSLIAPCRNERGHVQAFVASALAQQLPEGWSMELLVADGMSDDGTRAELTALASREPRLVVLDNPGRIVSTGLNRAIARARGEVLVRLDVHTTYAPDYVARCIEALEATGADTVGGPWVAEGETPMQRAIAAVFQSPWLAGGARSRDAAYSGWVDTVYLGAWRRETFEEYGTFDENLVRNQDDEHNLRITIEGGRIWQSAAIRSRYRPRSSIRALFRQYLQYGYWKPFVMRKHGQAAALRQFVPGAYVAALLLAAALWLLGGPFGPLGMLLIAYGVVVASATVSIATDQPNPVRQRVPPVIAAYHLGYGLGSVLGWIDVLTGAKEGRGRFAGLTR